jgi:TetR/AcrR family transcriptional regulator, fatty acid metabolism regulator protein
LTERSVNGRQQDRRRALLDAAVRVFARKGYHTCRVGDIAEEAGVAHGLLYHYFRSKEEVLETIFRESWSALLEAIRLVEDSGDPAREQLRKTVAIVLRTWKNDPDLVRVLVREITRSAHLQKELDELGHAFEALERIVRRGQAVGEFGSDVDPRLASYVVYGALEEILTGWVLGRLSDMDEDVARAERTVVQLVIDGLASERTPAPT